jgi:hypothetical protein
MSISRIKVACNAGEKIELDPGSPGATIESIWTNQKKCFDIKTECFII